MRLEEVRNYPGGITIGEPWAGDRKQGAYRAGCEFAKEILGVGLGKCLVIGSALFEARELSELGWDVTYLDLRDPKEPDLRVVVSDARDLPFPNKSFDAISTTCVITHAGTGRYGDSLDFEHGDEIMLKEIERVLKPGGRGALSFGPCLGGAMVRLGTVHRAYTVDEVKRLMGLANLKLSEIRIWSDRQQKWVPQPLSLDPEEPDYVSVNASKT